MTRSVLYARLHLAALLLTYGGWMFAAGAFGAPKLFVAGKIAGGSYTALGYTAALTWLVAVLLHSRLPALAVAANWQPLRAGGWAAILGAFGLWLGAAAHWRETFGVWLFGGPLEQNTIVYVRAVSGIGLAIAVFTVVTPSYKPTALFLADRTHIGNWETRRALVAGFVHAVVTALAIGLVASRPALPGPPSPFPEALVLFGAGYVAGILLASRQKYPQRQMGLLSWSAILAAAALLCVWCAPQSLWPVVVLGLAVGLGHMPARSVALSSAPRDQRTLALAIFAGLQILGLGLGGFVLYGVAGWPPVLQRGLFFVSMLVLAGLSIWFMRREIFEVTMDMTVGLNYPIHAFGPGVLQIPSRGPALIVANHHAMLDPLWLSKIVPMKVTALMTSKFFDLPIIRFLVSKVVDAIRVPDVTFRREAPEIQDAVAALRRGETVMIFPEGWLRRKEQQPIRRFGQGVFQILKVEPGTPVIACWIEGGWGSYTSFQNGPPGKGKKFDIRKRINIGVCVPKVLPPEILDDANTVRAYLMDKVVEARGYLGLPEISVPKFAAAEEEVAEEKDEAEPNSQADETTSE